MYVRSSSIVFFHLPNQHIFGMAITRCASQCESILSHWHSPPAFAITRSSSAPDNFTQAHLSHHANGCQETAHRRPLQVVTWNISAPNRNPFEYWAMHDDREYKDLMLSIQQCLDHPGKHDFFIRDVFTTAMYQDLRAEFEGLGVPYLEELDKVWSGDFSGRKAIAEFLKDASFGDKRLISMPDRITGSIKTQCGAEVFRPSPITGIQDEMGDIPTWWNLWKRYMFKTRLQVRGKLIDNVFSMIETIPRTKYPALTAAEEAMSRPLQTLCLALFDAVYMHLLSSVAAETWQPLKCTLHKALFENKTQSCVSILQRQYGDADVIFVQEASEAFADRVSAELDYLVLRPSGVDGRRSQMSLILARKSRFLKLSAQDLTATVMQCVSLKCIEKGDLCVFAIDSADGQYLLASFHGDSDGKATVPVLSALESLAKSYFPKHTLIFGLDANTANSTSGPSSLLNATDFNALLAQKGFSSCWMGQDINNLWTTFSARTYLQPQLQKAVGLMDVLDRRNMHLKDWILFYHVQLLPKLVVRDNTGRRDFHKAVMPSKSFPSDHAIVAVTLLHRSQCD